MRGCNIVKLGNPRLSEGLSHPRLSPRFVVSATIKLRCYLRIPRLLLGSQACLSICLGSLRSYAQSNGQHTASQELLCRGYCLERTTCKCKGGGQQTAGFIQSAFPRQCVPLERCSLRNTIPDSNWPASFPVAVLTHTLNIAISQQTPSPTPGPPQDGQQQRRGCP